jgi:hypothetical protein
MVSSGRPRASAMIVAVVAFVCGAAAMHLMDRRAVGQEPGSPAKTRQAAPGPAPGGDSSHPAVRPAEAGSASGAGAADAAASARSGVAALPGRTSSAAPDARAGGSSASAAERAAQPGSGVTGTASKMVRIPLEDAAGFFDGAVAVYQGAKIDLNQPGISTHFELGGHIHVMFGDHLSFSTNQRGVLIDGIGAELGSRLSEEIKRRARPKFPFDSNFYVLDGLPDTSLSIDQSKDGEWTFLISRNTPQGPG